MSLIPGHILIIDDDEYIRLTLKMFIEQHFKEVISISDPKTLPVLLRQNSFDVIMLDMNYQKGMTSGEEGMKWLKEVVKQDPDTSVVMITAYGDVKLAVEAMKAGAMDFVVKPWENEKLLATLNAGYRLSQSRRQVSSLKDRQKLLATTVDQRFSEIIGNSKAIRELFGTISKLAGTDANILILGENGTGKELVARAIHRNSNRSEGTFINVDLGSLSGSLFESEMFGFVKGAFTDAKEDRIGRFEAASGGSIFLDEIGNLTPDLQSKLLSVIDKKSVSRLGSNKEIEIDVRIISATNMPLKRMIEEEKFRQDLLYRINTVEIQIPPLRKRIEDIPLLVNYFLRIYGKKYHKPQVRVSESEIRKLQQYHWPGNIRELRHAIEREVIMSEGDLLYFNNVQGRSKTEDKTEHHPVAKDFNLDKIEKWAIENCIKKYNGNLTRVAEELGLSRGALYRRLDKHGI